MRFLPTFWNWLASPRADRTPAPRVPQPDPPSTAGQPTMSEPTASPELRRLIQKVSTGATLSGTEIRTALEEMTEGHATSAQMGAFLMALRVRGETVEEITGAAQMLRARMHKVAIAPGLVGFFIARSWDA